MTVSYRQFTGTGAENYERYFVPAIGAPVSGDLMRLAELRAGERVVDVACGSGLIARLAAGQVGTGGTVTGVDLAPDMIAVAEGRGSPSGASIDWHVADAVALPLPDDTYDVTLCQMGLMFVEDRASAVAEMRRVLRPGGRVVVSTPGAIQRPFELMEEAIVTHIGPELGGFVRAVFSMHDPDALAALLTGAGFRSASSTVSVTRLMLPGPAEFLWQYINLTPMAPFVAQAPAEAQAAMERQVVESWQPFVTDGTTIVDQPMVLARAER